MVKQVGALLAVACTMIAPSQAQQFPAMPTVSRAQALIQQGQLADGIAVLDSVLARNAGDIGARAWRGIAQFFMQQPEQALSDLHTANFFGLGGTGHFQYGTLYRMATVHAALGDTNRALQVLSEVVEGGLHSRDVLLDDVVNYRHANLVAVNGMVGRLDPEHLKPYMTSAKAVAPNLTWALLESTADYDALRVQAPKLATWLNQQRLNPLPDVIAWQTGRVFPKYDDAFWLRIDALSDTRRPDIFEPLALEQAPFFNPGFVWTYAPIMAKARKGTNIVRLFEGGALEQAGIQRGDFLQSIDGYSLDETSDYIPLNYLYTEGDGRQVPVVYERDGATGKTTLHFTALPPTYSFHNSARASRLQVRKVGNDVHVRADGVARFSLFIHPEHFDVTQGIDVIVNGTQKVTSAMVPVREAVLRNGRLLHNLGLLTVSVDEE